MPAYVLGEQLTRASESVRRIGRPGAVSESIVRVSLNERVFVGNEAVRLVVEYTDCTTNSVTTHGGTMKTACMHKYINFFREEF